MFYLLVSWVWLANPHLNGQVLFKLSVQYRYSSVQVQYSSGGDGTGMKYNFHASVLIRLFALYTVYIYNKANIKLFALNLGTMGNSSILMAYIIV
jgi:hypothetical protein